MAPHQVRVRMLSGFDVEIDGVAVPPASWRLSKARSLLKLLALTEGNRLHRDAIIEALWPDLGIAAATNNLHQVLHSARRALAAAGAPIDVLRLRAGIVALCSDGGLETDVHEVATALDKAMAEDDPDLLLDVARRCSVGLLPEDRYEDWARTYQDHIAGMCRTAVLAAVPRLVALGRADEAARVLQPIADARLTDSRFTAHSWVATTQPAVAGTPLRSMNRYATALRTITPPHLRWKQRRCTGECCPAKLAPSLAHSFTYRVRRPGSWGAIEKSTNWLHSAPDTALSRSAAPAAQARLALRLRWPEHSRRPPPTPTAFGR